jgi:hypothetical protein
MRTNAFVAIGTLCWLLPFAAAAWLVQKYGLHEQGVGMADSLPLLGIPLSMIALTVALGWLANRHRLSSYAIPIASAASFFAAIWWLAIWGRGV